MANSSHAIATNIAEANKSIEQPSRQQRPEGRVLLETIS